jgi:hypothetical protein
MSRPGSPHVSVAHISLLSQLSCSAPPGSREIEASVEMVGDALEVFYVRRAERLADDRLPLSRRGR